MFVYVEYDACHGTNVSICQHKRPSHLLRVRCYVFIVNNLLYFWFDKINTKICFDADMMWLMIFNFIYQKSVLVSISTNWWSGIILALVSSQLSNYSCFCQPCNHRCSGVNDTRASIASGLPHLFVNDTRASMATGMAWPVLLPHRLIFFTFGPRGVRM